MQANHRLSTAATAGGAWLRRGRWLACGFLLSAALAANEDLAWMDLEQLGKIKVVTASKRSQLAWTTPAAVSLITGEEMTFSGVNSLPQALRLAPGVDVAQINSQRHSVAIRGFAGEFSDKLLVLQDGRSLYTPQFLGVFWDAQDTLLDDVQRIEVVRGPGGTAWGVNAVNGVVNILTKDAADTQGTQVRLGAGTFESTFASVRYGGKWNDSTHFRVYAKSFARGETEGRDGRGSGDDWRQSRVGFRVDAERGSSRHLTLQGEGYGGQLLQYVNRQPDSFLSSGGHVLGRWAEQFSADAGLELRAYFDTVRRRSAPATANSDTWSLEASHYFAPAPGHRFTWSGTAVQTRNEARGRVGHNYSPAVRTLLPFGLTLADDYAAIPDRLTLSAGLKAEHNDFSGWEMMPSARLTWTPSERKTGWLAVSRGLQNPSIADYDLTIDVPGALRVMSLPNRNRLPGEVLAYEVGWRVEPSRTLVMDAAVFYHAYDRLSSSQSTLDSTGTVLTVMPNNARFGEAHGAEVAAIWQPFEWWRVRASYSLLRLHLHVRPGSTDAAGSVRLEGSSPSDQWQVMSVQQLGRKWNLTTWLRTTSARPALALKSYTALDLRLAWRASQDWELALAAKDLLDPRHGEFSRSVGFPANSEVPRSVTLEAVLRR